MHEVQVRNGTNHYQRKHGDTRQNLRQQEIHKTNKTQMSTGINCNGVLRQLTTNSIITIY